MVATVALLAALFAAGFALFYYSDAFLRGTARGSVKVVSPRAWLLYRVAAALSLAAAGGLLYIIVTDQFQYSYVASYSSRELAFFYKVSAFWAGQAGSFLLWLAFHACFGLIVGRRNSEPAVMATYTMVQILLTILVLAKSPFDMLAEPLAEGSGLNPLLQDFWMIIHPPIVFLGYAALSVPLAYAVGGLLTNDHRSWLSRALPWTLFAWSALGAGIFIGGFWAYKVLGWGGYWSWDPVENASLVPWLVATGLFHLLLVARQRPAAVRFAYPAALCSYILVLYGTFLTRSGVLSDFSVHSFASEGIGGLLGGITLVTIAVLLTILGVRWRNLPQGESFPDIKSREFTALAGTAALLVLAGLVFVGMSTPLVTMLVGQPQSVSATFYNTISQPLTTAILVLVIISTLARWGGTDLPRLREVWWVLVAGPAALFGGIWLGIQDPITLTSLGIAGAVLAVSVIPRQAGRITWAAAVGHTGLALMILGIIVSSTASRSTVVNFLPGQSNEVLGAQIVYLGQQVAEDGRGFYQSFSIDGTNVVKAHTKLNKEDRPAAREPAIRHTLAADLYLAPVMKHDHHFDKQISLQKGEQRDEQGLTIKFIKFGMRRDETQAVHLAAFLEVSKEGESKALAPEIVSRDGQFTPVAVDAFGYRFTLTSVDTAGGKVAVGLQSLAKPEDEPVAVEISHKPLVNLVWLGATLIALSGLAAARRSAAGFTAAVSVDDNTDKKGKAK